MAAANRRGCPVFERATSRQLGGLADGRVRPWHAREAAGPTPPSKGPWTRAAVRPSPQPLTRRATTASAVRRASVPPLHVRNAPGFWPPFRDRPPQGSAWKWEAASTTGGRRRGAPTSLYSRAAGYTALKASGSATSDRSSPGWWKPPSHARAPHALPPLVSPSTSRCAANACGNCECRPMGIRGARGGRTQCGSHPWVPLLYPLLHFKPLPSLEHAPTCCCATTAGGQAAMSLERATGSAKPPLQCGTLQGGSDGTERAPHPLGNRLEEPDHGCTKGRLLPGSSSAQLGRCGRRHCHVPWSGSSGGSRGAPEDPLRTYAN